MHITDEHATRELVTDAQKQLDALEDMLLTAKAPVRRMQPQEQAVATADAGRGGSGEAGSAGLTSPTSSVEHTVSMSGTWTDADDADPDDVKGRVGTQWAWERDSVPSPVQTPKRL